MLIHCWIHGKFLHPLTHALCGLPGRDGCLNPLMGLPLGYPQRARSICWDLSTEWCILPTYECDLRRLLPGIRGVQYALDSYQEDPKPCFEQEALGCTLDWPWAEGHTSQFFFSLAFQCFPRHSIGKKLTLDIFVRKGARCYNEHFNLNNMRQHMIGSMLCDNSLLGPQNFHLSG